MKSTLSPRLALLSVSDKTNILMLAQTLIQHSVKIISTGGTAKFLIENNIPVTMVEEITGNPEAFGGRMKSISFQIASALLYRRDHDQDEKEARDLNIPKIDLVVCNLYPFEKYTNQNIVEEKLIEEIDIGGPLMIRAAAKNYHGVSVLVDPSQYSDYISCLNTDGGTTYDYRRCLAVTAFDRIAQYDIAIAEELGGRFSEDRKSKFIKLDKVQDLRYGENPHQKSTWYRWDNASTKGLGDAEVLQGKELSYNNLLDADAAWKVLSDVQYVFNQDFTAVVVKHGNPCGLAHGTDSLKTLSEAWNGDSVSAFGGIIAINTQVTKVIAEFFNERFIEILMAPDFTSEALEVLGKKKNVRLLKLPIREKNNDETVIRSFHSGVLMQDEDETLADFKGHTIRTKKTFAPDQKELVQFGVVACKHLKSNGIALVAKNAGVYTLVGAGMGQPNRLDSLHLLASPRAHTKNADFSKLVLISDAFFPFADSIEAANKYGIKYIVQPGGSIRDEEVIKAADDFGMAMLFTGERHFRH